MSQPVHGATVSGNVPYPAVWLAAACLALGAFLARGYLTGMFEPQEGSALQPWMFGAFAALALHAGGVFAVFGARDVRRARARRRGLASRRAAEPWTWDHPWHRRGASDGSAAELATLWVVAPAWCLMLAPFVALVFFPDGTFDWRGAGADAPWWVRAMVGVFVLVGAGLVVRAVAGLLAHLLRGPAFLRFDDFPFRPGGRLTAVLETPAPIRADRVTVRLRCVRERVVHDADRRTGRTSGLRTEFEELYGDTAEIELDAPPTRRVPIAFDLPADAPATRLSDAPPQYWKLDVQFPGRKVAFLVPVYRDD